MAFVLPSTEYDSIRDVLGLSSTDLTSTTIERTPFLPTAEAEVKAIVTGYAAITTGDNLTHLYGAIIYRTAALLCDRQANMQRSGERLGDYAAGTIDWAKRKADCLAEYQSHLGSITTQAAPAVTLLTLGGVSRAVNAERASEEDLTEEETEFQNI